MSLSRSESLAAALSTTRRYLHVLQNDVLSDLTNQQNRIEKMMFTIRHASSLSHFETSFPLSSSPSLSKRNRKEPSSFFHHRLFNGRINMPKLDKETLEIQEYRNQYPDQEKGTFEWNKTQRDKLKGIVQEHITAGTDISWTDIARRVHKKCNGSECKQRWENVEDPLLKFSC